MYETILDFFLTELFSFLAFSFLVDYYLKISFDLKTILYIAIDDFIHGDWAPLSLYWSPS